MSIKRVTFLGQEAYQLENNYFSALVLPREGSNVLSLVHKTSHTSILRTPSSYEEYEQRKMVYGTPVLFPPNRIEDATFTFQGKTYELDMNRAKENNHIHGFVHDKPWNVIEINSDENILVTSLSSVDFPSICTQFPHHFELVMTIGLTETGLLQTLEIRNVGRTSSMPVGIGYHTTFNFPLETSSLQIDVNQTWELNERGLPTGILKDIPYQEKLKRGMNIKDVALDDVFPMTSNKKAVMTHPTNGLKVTYEALEGFQHWVLFNANKTGNLLAIEPYSWVTNAPNLSLPDEITGMDSIPPQSNKRYVTEIRIDSL